MIDIHFSNSPIVSVWHPNVGVKSFFDEFHWTFTTTWFKRFNHRVKITGSKIFLKVRVSKDSVFKNFLFSMQLNSEHKTKKKCTVWVTPHFQKVDFYGISIKKLALINLPSHVQHFGRHSMMCPHCCLSCDRMSGRLIRGHYQPTSSRRSWSMVIDSWNIWQ